MEIVTRSITRALRSCDNWNESMLDCTVKIKRDRKIDILGLQNRHVQIKRRFSFSQNVGQTQKPAKRQRSASVSCIMPSEVQNCIANFRALMSKYMVVSNSIQATHILQHIHILYILQITNATRVMTKQSATSRRSIQ